MRNNKGFSLIELTIVIGFIGVIFLIAANMLKIGTKSLEMGFKEFEAQSNVRVAAQTTMSKIRFSTAIFTIPEGSFSYENNPDQLAKEWDYFGIENLAINGKPASQIVEYTWDGNAHIQRIVVQPKEGITYSLEFFKDISVSDIDSSIDENNIMNFKIVGYLNGDTSNPCITLDVGSLASNSLQVMDYGTSLDKAVAIAYRSDVRPGTFVGHIALILDYSGSMNSDMKGSVDEYLSPIAIDGPPRYEILQDAARSLLNELSAHNNIDISIIKFSNSANNPLDFLNAQTGNASLISYIDSMSSPEGGTNTGDAIRRAYYQLLNHNATVSTGITPINYLIVLVDGDTTFCSINSYNEEHGNAMVYPSDVGYYYEDGDIENESSWLYLYQDPLDPYKGVLSEYANIGSYPLQITGGGSYMLDITSEYVREWASRFAGSPPFATPFVIALSDAVSDRGINDIKTYLNAPEANVFSANDSESLNRAFKEIMNKITNELWHLNGPRL